MDVFFIIFAASNENNHRMDLMKKLVLTVVAGLMALGVVAQGSQFTATAEVEGMINNVMYYLTDAFGGCDNYGVKNVVDGKVDFSFDMDEVGQLVIVFSYTSRASVPAIPGEHLVIGGDLQHLTYGGSPVYEEFGKVMTATQTLRDAYWTFDFKTSCKNEILGKSPEEVMELYRSKNYGLYRGVADACLSYMKEHPDNVVSMLLLPSLMDNDDLDKARGLIKEELLLGPLNPYYEAAVNAAKTYGFSNPLLDKPAPELDMTDLDGKPLSLSSLRDKWVLLDFWESNCGNAISQFPILKEMYAQYQDRLEIVGVDWEDNEEDWKSAVTKYQLPWMNVNGTFDMDDPKNPMNLYETTATPYYFLIAPSGKIVKTGGSAGDYKYLFELIWQ